MEHAGAIIASLVEGVSPFIVVKRNMVFDLPVVLLGANREFKIFSSDGVPVLQYRISNDVNPRASCMHTL